MEKEYVCICGKKFNNPQSFNAHKGHCKIHQLNKYGSLDNLSISYKNRGKQISKGLRNKFKDNKKNKEQKLEQWKKEEHRCECCGKIMTDFYGSGRFCSQSCANSRKHSQETKEKISMGVKTSDIVINHTLKKENIENYNKNPKYCIICNNIIPYELRYRQTCCDECCTQYRSIQLKGKTGGYIENSGNLYFHKGYYKGIYCDSTYELVYVIYNLDHNIKFKRCKRVYDYKYQEKTHKYHPDFELEDGTLIEIKGYITDNLKAKIASVKDRHLKVLYKKDLEYAFKYVEENYKYNQLKDLYD